MAQEQLPAAQYTVGGQETVADHVVISQTDGFEEDGEAKKTAAGQHKCDLTYSRRATRSLVLELAFGADPTTYMEGGGLDASYVPGGEVWEIRSVSRVNTRGPVQLNLELVSLTDTITA
jgi:hypothetical protein